MKSRCFLYACIACLLYSSSIRGQVSLSSAVSLAVGNSPKIRVAEDDLRHSVASLSEAKDIYIPSVLATGGLGRSYGITLSVPTIFTASAQSLIFSYAQRSYIRSARESTQASALALDDAREQVEEDAVITYISLISAEERLSVTSQKALLAQRALSITNDRVNVGVDSAIELDRSRRLVLQSRLQQFEIRNEIDVLRAHLAELTGMPAGRLETVATSVPAVSSFASSSLPAQTNYESPGILSSEANLLSKTEQAAGDSRYAFRPQISFFAQYGRISPVNDVTDYYNLHGKYDTFAAGISIVLPLIDRVHSAKARETMIDVQHARDALDILRGQMYADRSRSQRSLLELSTRLELAQVDQDIAEEELKGMLAQLNSSSGANGAKALTPKDEQLSRLEERQRYIEVLDRTLEVYKANISLLRQTGNLDSWIAVLRR